MIRRGAIAIALAVFSLLPARASGRADYDLALAWRAFVAADTRPRIGVALGGGGARGMAHIGVLRSLDGAGIPVEAVAGTSIGSFIGALYATGAEIDKIENLALETNWSNLIELKMSRMGFFSTRRLEQFINFHLQFLKRNLERPVPSRDSDVYDASDLKDLSFRDLKIPFACTATDLYSGSVVIFDTGSVAEAVRASCSIPGLFEPVPYGDELLVDGGVILNLPVSLCRDLGAEIVIGVDLESDTPPQIAGFVDVLTQIIKIQGRSLSADERLGADGMVQPRVASIRTTDLNMTADAIREGAIAGTKAAGMIKENLLRHRTGWRPAAGSGAEREPSAERSDSEEALRRALVPIRGRGSSSGSSSGAMIAAAQAAAKLGLYREALEYIGAIPEKDRNAACRIAEAMSCLRTRKKSEAAAALEKLAGMDVDADRYWELAAAAVDVRFDDLAREILKRIPQRA